MSEPQRELSILEKINVEPEQASSGFFVSYLVAVSGALLLLALIFTYKGWSALEAGGLASLAGVASRATVYVNTGIVCALGAVVFAVFAVVDKLPKNSRF